MRARIPSNLDCTKPKEGGGSKMKIKNGAEYIESLRKIHPIVYYKGKRIQDGTHMEPMAMSFMAATGAHMVIFVTGCGGTFGHAIVPFIKVTGNPETYRRMSQDMDINAGTIINGEESMESAGKRIFKEVIEVASGKLTLGEILGYNNFFVFRQDPRLEALLGINKSLA
jgi:altronate dehydratase large subunit